MARPSPRRAWKRCIVCRSDRCAPRWRVSEGILALEGLLEARFENGAKSADVEGFAELLHDCPRPRRRAGRALDGPHRSDLKAATPPRTWMPINAPLANKRRSGGPHAGAGARPRRRSGRGALAILIDEAAAHLDAVRRAALFDELLANPGQAWLTGTDENLFEAFGARAQMFEVREGQVHAA